jgi:hypothetical protein
MEKNNKVVKAQVTYRPLRRVFVLPLLRAASCILWAAIRMSFAYAAPKALRVAALTINGLGKGLVHLSRTLLR